MSGSAAASVPVVALVGEIFDGAGERIEARSLVHEFGRTRALADAVGCVEELAASVLAEHGQ